MERAMLPFINPATGQPFGQMPATLPAEVPQMLAELRAVAPAWAARPVAERVRVLRQLQKVLLEARDEISAVITQDTGKGRQDSLLETFVTVDNLSTNCSNAPHWLRPEKVWRGLYIFKDCTVAPRPYGVVGIIAPWNYPLLLSIVPLTTALLAGNVVLLKPSEIAGASGQLVEQLLQRVPELTPYVRVAHGDGAVGAALVEAKPDFIFLTGSTATGKKVGRAAAEHLIPFACELGGKDPMIVLEDADLPAAAAWGAWGACFNSGQSCVGIEHAFVVESVYDEFVQRVVDVTANLKVDFSMSPYSEHAVGPIAYPRQMEILERQMADAVAKGARVLTGGHRQGNFFIPTVVVDVTPDMLLMREETFGPILPVIKVKDEAEAIARTNASAYGLSASVWTRDLARGRRVAAQLQVGATLVNDTISHFGIPTVPIGGFKESGIGRTHGKAGMLQFTQPSAVIVSQPPVDWDITSSLRKPGRYWLAGALMRLIYGATVHQRLEPVAELLSHRAPVSQLHPPPIPPRQQLGLWMGALSVLASLALFFSWLARKSR